MTRSAPPTRPLLPSVNDARYSTRAGDDGREGGRQIDAGDMHGVPLPDIEVVRRADRVDAVDGRKLRRALSTGEWIRVTTGVFVRSSQWSDLRPIEQHRVLTAEVARRRREPVLASHFAAAALCDIDVLGAWPSLVDITVTAKSGGRSSGSIRRRFGDPESAESVEFGRHRRTSPAQTALDLARTEPFVRGVAIVDQAIRADRDGGALTSIDEISLLIAGSAPHRGNGRAERALAFADPGAANVRESELRVLVHELGFPEPRTQERRILRTGRLVYGDLYFPDHDHWLELDGRGKYTSPQFTRGLSPADVVMDEKQRENEIRREVRGFSRLEPSDLNSPRQVYDILRADGLHSAKPRP